MDSKYSLLFSLRFRSMFPSKNKKSEPVSPLARGKSADLTLAEKQLLEKVLPKSF